jgi:hypothetical protein
MGKEIYSLHDNGRKLFTTARDCTPIQRFVYVMAKNHHTDDPKKGSPNPSGMDKAKKFNQATVDF